MQKIDFQKFLLAVQGPLGEFTTRQKLGLEYLIGSLQDDTLMTDLRWCAYSLATSWHETGHELMPIEEYGKGKGKPYGGLDPQTRQRYYGRGYTQNTWKSNYLMLTKAWDKANPDKQVDFVMHPELMLIPAYSYWAMSYSMRNGTYTGVGLPKYFNADRDDPVSARKIVNGTDCAEKIAGYHKIFLKALDDNLEVK